MEMTLCEKCNSCPGKVAVIEKEKEQAERWYAENGIAWRFECGASYHPGFADQMGADVIPSQETCHYDKWKEIMEKAAGSPPLPCERCYYNFDGICGNHTPLPEADRYGQKTSELQGCYWGRFMPSFLSNQTQD